jgi:hypothetical protein
MLGLLLLRGKGSVLLLKGRLVAKEGLDLEVVSSSL